MNKAVNLYKKSKSQLSDIAPYFLFALLIVQPLLDIISHWSNVWSFTAITTVARLGMFLMVMLYGFIISDKKWAYIATAAVIGVYWAGHIAACVLADGGYVDPVGDANNFLRTVHLPLFTLVFITVFKKSSSVPDYVQKAFCINMVITLHSLLLSYMTGTQVYTYVYAKIGLMGWAYAHNTQSAILAFIVPLILLFAYRKGSRLYFYIACVACFANLFFVGTKVDYFSIFIIAVGMIVMMILVGEKRVFYYALLGSLTVFCALCYNASPAAQIFGNHTFAMETKQQAVEVVIENATPEQEDKDERPPIPDYMSWEIFNSLDPKSRYEIVKIYERFLGPMVDEFGFERIFERYEFTKDVSVLTDVRKNKREYAQMKFEDANDLSRIFGYEYITLVKYYETEDANGNIIVKEEIYDLENDFPAVFYYSGYAGFALYILFLAYFVGLILVGVITRFKRIVTLESGLVGITFALMLGSSQFAGHVLRRPNASVYISVILAYIYYLTVIKENVKYRDLLTIFKRKDKKSVKEIQE